MICGLSGQKEKNLVFFPNYGYIAPMTCAKKHIYLTLFTSHTKTIPAFAATLWYSNASYKIIRSGCDPAQPFSSKLICFHYQTQLLNYEIFRYIALSI